LRPHSKGIPVLSSIERQASPGTARHARRIGPTVVDLHDRVPPGRPGRTRELALFLGVGGGVAVLGHVLLLVLMARGLSAGVANVVQAVVTLQLSFLGNDLLTYRDRIAGGQLGRRQRWLRYQVSRVWALIVTTSLFVPVAAVIGPSRAYWLMIATGTGLNYVADRLLSHPVRGDALTLPDHPRVRALLAMLLGAVVLGLPAVLHPDVTILAGGLLMLMIAVTTISFQLYAWRTPEASTRDDELVPDPPSLRFAVFLAARHEAAVLGATLARMSRLDHPDYTVYVVVDHRDDWETAAIAHDYERRFPGVIRAVEYPDVPRSSKPIALNEAMRQLRRSGEHWDVVGVADAEDRFHVHLLRTVDHLVRTTDAGVVQGAVQLINFGVHPHADTSLRSRWRHRTSAWWRSANCLEYFKWFSSRLKLQAALGVMPLGGNTVFFSRAFMDALYERAGTWWDEECLTEDCKIGILASIMGFHVEVFAQPRLATLEETPATLPKFVRQRVRWMQGFIQVFSEGEWLQLPTLSQRLMAVYVLGFQFLQALAGVFAPLAVVLALTHKAPVPIVLVALLPVLVSFWNLVIDVIMLRDFAHTYARVDDAIPMIRGRRSPIGLLDYVGLVLGAYPYQLVLAVSALGAIYRSLAGVSDWVKTEHTGAHLWSDHDDVVARDERVVA
jgi:cellulose synthase/poly-beta-1,6-N-acetylglucosamine synthase-like glycosyltransferase/putative flippase GtrA